MNVKIIKSRRKTLAIELKPGTVIVRAPFGVSRKQISDFIDLRRGWIENKLGELERQREQMAGVPKLSPEELEELKDRARAYLPERVAHYAPMLGVSCGRISIKSQRSRWGSCSAKGNLNFNCLLMLAPPQVIDSVVVHELCHLREMNHSKRFYGLVLEAFPEYRQWRGWLRENGAALIQRLPDRV